MGVRRSGRHVMLYRTKQKKLNESRDRVMCAHRKCRSAEADVREAELERTKREKELDLTIRQHEALVTRLAKL